MAGDRDQKVATLAICLYRCSGGSIPSEFILDGGDPRGTSLRELELLEEVTQMPIPVSSSLEVPGLSEDTI